MITRMVTLASIAVWFAMLVTAKAARAQFLAPQSTALFEPGTSAATSETPFGVLSVIQQTFRRAGWKRQQDLWFRPEPFRAGWFIEARSNRRDHGLAVSHIRQLSDRIDGTGWRLVVRAIAKPGLRDATGEAGLVPVRSVRGLLEHGWRRGNSHIAAFAGVSREAQEGLGGSVRMAPWRFGAVLGGHAWLGWPEAEPFRLSHVQIYGEFDQALAAVSVINRLGFRLGKSRMSLGPEIQFHAGPARRHGNLTYRPAFREWRLGLGLGGIEFGDWQLGFAAGSEWARGKPARPYATISLSWLE
jgi:hypothetical protein